MPIEPQRLAPVLVASDYRLWDISKYLMNARDANSHNRDGRTSRYLAAEGGTISAFHDWYCGKMWVWMWVWETGTRMVIPSVTSCVGERGGSGKDPPQA